MMELNLVHLEKSDIKYKIGQFPDGEFYIELEDRDIKDIVYILTRITSPKDIFILLLVVDIFKRRNISYSIKVSYLMGARNDRLFSINKAIGAEVVLQMLKEAGEVDIYEPHNPNIIPKYTDMMSVSNFGFNEEFCKDDPFLEYIEELLDRFDTHKCYPDKSAKDKYQYRFWQGKDLMFFNKKRTEKSIELHPEFMTGFQVEEDIIKNIVVIDDLCDAGGTFLAVANTLKSLYPSAKLTLIVFHMVNGMGIINTSKVYDEVVFTNSFKDWNSESIPENCKCIDII